MRSYVRRCKHTKVHSAAELGNRPWLRFLRGDWLAKSPLNSLTPISAQDWQRKPMSSRKAADNLLRWRARFIADPLWLAIGAAPGFIAGRVMGKHVVKIPAFQHPAAGSCLCRIPDRHFSCRTEETAVVQWLVLVAGYVPHWAVLFAVSRRQLS